MDMMFNTDVIVKDMKGDKEDMTEKRFKLRLSKLGNGMITDTQKREDLYFDKEFLDDTLPKTNEWLNELHEENVQLKQFQEQVASVIEGKMGDNVCNDYKMEVLKEIWNELELDELWFE